jgi:hypothetical protein
MTPRRAEVLAFIEAEIDAGRPFPSDKRIAECLGLRDGQSAHDFLNALWVMGHLERRGREPVGAKRIVRALAEREGKGAAA